MSSQEKEPIFSVKNLKLLTSPFGQNNPITVQILGICSALAVTAKLKPAFVMALSVIVVTGFSSLIISLIRKGIPSRIRIIVQLVVVAALVILVFSTVTTTFLDAWSAGISAESLTPKLNGKKTAIVVTVIGVAGAILFPMDDITGFLYLIGSVFAPMIAVQIADHFILKRDRFAVAADARNLVIWLVGFIAYRLLMGVDTPVGYTLPDMVLTVVLCLIAEKVRPTKE